MAVLRYDSCNNKIEDLVSTETPADRMDNLMDIDPYIVFSNALWSPPARQKYIGRLNSFYDFISLPQSRL